MAFRPTDEDENLWNHVTKGAKKFLSKKSFKKTKQSIQQKNVSDMPILMSTRIHQKIEKQSIDYDPQLNRRDMERLRKGQISIEAKLDLHGMRQEQAFDKLQGFVASSYNKGLRCVLVITGKGSLSSPSILREKLPQWIRQGNNAQIVLKIVQAHKKDGGSGAFYIYLRRK